jgi:hypothetical protein
MVKINDTTFPDTVTETAIGVVIVETALFTLLYNILRSLRFIGHYIKKRPVALAERSKA